MTSRFLPFAAALLFVIAALVACGSSLDDPYIFSRYASNLLSQGDIVWNVGEGRVEGFTSWAWMGVHALGLQLGCHPVGFSRLVGVLLGAVNAGFFFALLRRSLGFWPTVAFGLVGALSPDIWFYAASGMDTLLWTVAAWAWLLWFARAERVEIAHLAAAGALLAVRPEAMLLLALFAFRAALEVRANVVSVRSAVRIALLGGMVPCALLAARYYFFGQIVANSVAAKHLGGSAWLRALGGLVYVADVGQMYLLPLAVVLAMALAAGLGPWNWRQVLSTEESRRVATLGGFAILTLAMIVAAGGDDTSAFPFARLLVPILGPLAFCLAIALQTVARDRRSVRAASMALIVVFVSTFLPRAKSMVALSVGATNMTSLSEFGSEILRRAAPGRSSASTVLLRETPVGETVALPWAGRIPYETGLRTIDLLGLNDRHIASLPSPQRGIDVKYDADYVLRQRPYFICESVAILREPAEIAGMTSGELYRAGAWKKGQRDLLQDPRLARDYELDSGASAATGGSCFRRSN